MNELDVGAEEIEKIFDFKILLDKSVKEGDKLCRIMFEFDSRAITSGMEFSDARIHLEEKIIATIRESSVWEILNCLK